MTNEEHNDNSNNLLCKSDNNNNVNGNSFNNNILLLPPSMRDLIEKYDLHNDLLSHHNDILHDFPQLFFEWMSRFTVQAANIYPKIIAFLLVHDVCYSGSICKTFPGVVKQGNIITYFNTLLGNKIIQKVQNNRATELQVKLKAHEKVFKLNHAPKGIDKIQFYELTEFAKLFFGEYDFWKWKLKNQDIEAIQNYEHKLSKSHKQIKQRQEKQKEEIEEYMPIWAEEWYSRMHDGEEDAKVVKHKHYKMWLEPKAEKLGVSLEEMDNILRERPEYKELENREQKGGQDG